MFIAVPFTSFKRLILTPNAAQPSLRGVLLHALEHSRRLGDKTRACALMNGARSPASLEVVRNDRGEGDNGDNRSDCDGHPNKTLHTGKSAARGGVGAAHFFSLSEGHARYLSRVYACQCKP